MDESSETVSQVAVMLQRRGKGSAAGGGGKVIAYIGYLSLKGKVRASSAPQYESAISRYHVNHGYASPTLTPTVKNLSKTFVNKAERTCPNRSVRVGSGAEVMTIVLEFGLVANDVEDVGACATVIFSFIFHFRAVTVAHVTPPDVSVTVQSFTAHLTHRKGKSSRRPLLLTYARSSPWAPDCGPDELFCCFISLRPQSAELFNLRSTNRLGTARLATSAARALALVDAVPPPGSYYGSHSPRIGALNELLNLHYPKLWIMHHMDWSSEGMFSVYFDSRIIRTAMSEWFFGHLRGFPVAPPH